MEREEETAPVAHPSASENKGKRRLFESHEQAHRAIAGSRVGLAHGSQEQRQDRRDDTGSHGQESRPQTPCSVLSDPFDLADEFSSVVGATEETDDTTLAGIIGCYEASFDSSSARLEGEEDKRRGRVFADPGPAPVSRLLGAATSSPAPAHSEPSPELGRRGHLPLSSLVERREIHGRNAHNGRPISAISTGESLRNPYHRSTTSQDLPRPVNESRQLQADDFVPSMWRLNSTSRRNLSVETQAYQGASQIRPSSSKYSFHSRDDNDWETINDPSGQSQAQIQDVGSHTPADASVYSQLANETPQHDRLQQRDLSTPIVQPPSARLGHVNSFDSYDEEPSRNPRIQQCHGTASISSRGSNDILSQKPVSPPFTPGHARQPFSFNSTSDRLGTPSHYSQGSHGSTSLFISPPARPPVAYSPSPLANSHTSRLRAQTIVDDIEPLHPGNEDPNAIELRKYPTHRSREPVTNPYRRAQIERQLQELPTVLKKRERPGPKGKTPIRGLAITAAGGEEAATTENKPQVFPSKKAAKSVSAFVSALTKRPHFLTPDYSFSDHKLYERSKHWRLAPSKYRNAHDPADPELALEQIDIHRNESLYGSTEHFFPRGINNNASMSKDRRGPHVFGGQGTGNGNKKYENVTNNGNKKYENVTSKMNDALGWSKTKLGLDNKDYIAGYLVRGRHATRTRGHNSAIDNHLTGHNILPGGGSTHSRHHRAWYKVRGSRTTYANMETPQRDQRIVLDQQRLERHLDNFSWVMLALMLPACPLLLLYAYGCFDVLFLYGSGGAVEGVGQRQKTVAKRLGVLSFVLTLVGIAALVAVVVVNKR